MNGDSVRAYARDVLGLALTEVEANELAPALDAIRELVEQIESVPLPYFGEPFTSPRHGDR